ncbi:hypothetical protein [Gimesia aquarii]|uniref:Uncharacterized protein n=1 Tax=Gimesia aquarii TaxID=2527964 RepID=A0A517WQX6_9PLAN|nr:hypothetical protein [Gimesia aquarii]QDU07667.1 hypothetical protein V202x_10260 [Gimesia aquarii]
MKRFAIISLVTLIAFTIHTSVAYTEIAPGLIANMKKKAPEVFKVEIRKVTQADTTMPSGRINVAYETKVLEVLRSKSGVKVGDTITIETYYLHPNPKTPEEVAGVLSDILGPKHPVLLSKQWKGKVYLHSPRADKKFKIAVFGRSFEREKKKGR